MSSWPSIDVNSLAINLEGIIWLLKDLNQYKAEGPGRIKEMADQMASALALVSYALAKYLV